MEVCGLPWKLLPSLEEAVTWFVSGAVLCNSYYFLDDSCTCVQSKIAKNLCLLLLFIFSGDDVACMGAGV